MHWLNIETRTLHAPEYIGVDPSARATWLNLMLWCAEQENGGIIPDARSWTDRRWQQTCGVTAAEVAAASPLVRFEADAVHLAFYPLAQQQTVLAKRKVAQANGLLGGRPARLKPISEPTPVPMRESTSQPTPESVREGKEKEGKEKKDGGRAVVTAPVADSEWLAGLGANEAYRGLNITTEFAKMQAWCSANSKQPTRRRFINWLNRADKPMQARSGYRPGPVDGPARWRDKLKQLYPDSTFDGPWPTLVESVRLQILEVSGSEFSGRF